MVAKETSSKSQLPAGVGGVHLIDCGYLGSPTDCIPTYCVFQLSAPPKFNKHHLPNHDALSFTASIYLSICLTWPQFFFNPICWFTGLIKFLWGDGILKREFRFFFKGLHVGVKHLKTFLSIAADFQVFASNLAVFLIFSQLWCFFEFLWWRILRESSIMVL